MKTILTLIALLMPLGQLRAGKNPEEKRAILSAAVFNFAEGSKELAGTGASIGELMNAYLSTSEGLILVERAELNKVLAEQELSLTGNVDAASTIKAGKLTGAQILVTGRVFQTGSKTFVIAKVIGSETGRVYAATVNFGGADELADQVQSLAAKVAKLIGDKGDLLAPPMESYEDLIARLKKDLIDPLPTVYVRIPEEHLTKPVPDPACQTEILRLIKDCGFGITDNSEKADIRITGEAFSELATRRGKLVACRARTEIKIHSKKSSDLVRVDRVMVGAVDLAEHAAAKAALQEAGLRLAIRFVENQKEK